MSEQTGLCGDELAAWERFAAAALEGWAAGRNNENFAEDAMTGDATRNHHAKVADACGRYADSMMVERRKRLVRLDASR